MAKHVGCMETRVCANILRCFSTGQRLSKYSVCHGLVSKDPRLLAVLQCMSKPWDAIRNLAWLPRRTRVQVLCTQERLVC